VNLVNEDREGQDLQLHVLMTAREDTKAVWGMCVRSASRPVVSLAVVPVLQQVDGK
jgi:hypothetical protein